MIGRRHLLYLAADRLSAYVWQRKRLAAEGHFAATEEGLADFTAYLKAHRNCPLRILVNSRDEGQQIEIIPYLSSRDRQAVIARKTRQLFPGTPLATAISLGWEKGERRNERLLLWALTRSAGLEPWLDCIADAGAPLAGIHALSQLGPSLLRKAAKLPERCLLLTVLDRSIQESFLIDGKTAFSRLVSIPENGTADTGSILAAESARLHRYLSGQNQIGSQESLPLFILADPLTVKGGSSSAIAGLPGTLLDCHGVARRLGLRTPLAGHGCELLFLHLLALQPPRQQFAGSRLRRDYRFVQVQRLLLTASTAALIAALPFAWSNFSDTRIYSRESAQWQQREQEAIRRHQEISAALPQLPVDYDTLQRISARFADLQPARLPLRETFQLVSQALDASPAIEIDTIDWQLSPEAATTRCCRERIALQGRLRRDPDFTPPQALANFTGFVEALQRNFLHGITVRRSPFDAPSGQPDSGLPFAIEMAKGGTP